MILFVLAHEAAGDVHRHAAMHAPVGDDPRELPRGVHLMRARPKIDSNAHAERLEIRMTPVVVCCGERGQGLEARFEARASRRIEPPSQIWPRLEARALKIV
jgi:hypothetical protein